jgi:hypothetical protein
VQAHLFLRPQWENQQLSFIVTTGKRPSEQASSKHARLQQWPHADRQQNDYTMLICVDCSRSYDLHSAERRNLKRSEGENDDSEKNIC